MGQVRHVGTAPLLPTMEANDGIEKYQGAVERLFEGSVVDVDGYKSIQGMCQGKMKRVCRMTDSIWMAHDGNVGVKRHLENRDRPLDSKFSPNLPRLHRKCVGCSHASADAKAVRNSPLGCQC